MQYRTGKYLHLFGYVNSVKLFLPYLEKLRTQIFQFKKTHIVLAQNKLEKLGCHENSDTIVSIHVRMGDYLDLLHGIPEAATPSYYTRAMEYFESKYSVKQLKGV